MLASNPYLSKNILNERNSSSDKVVGGDGVAVGARARVDVEGPEVTGRRFRKDLRINCDQNNTRRQRGDNQGFKDLRIVTKITPAVTGGRIKDFRT